MVFLVRSSVLGVFEFVIALVFITTIGKVVRGRRSDRALRAPTPPSGHGELEGLREAIDDMSGRFERLEEERDSYRDLLDSPGVPRKIQPPDPGKQASD